MCLHKGKYQVFAEIQVVKYQNIWIDNSSCNINFFASLLCPNGGGVRQEMSRLWRSMYVANIMTKSNITTNLVAITCNHSSVALINYILTFQSNKKTLIKENHYFSKIYLEAAKNKLNCLQRFICSKIYIKFTKYWTHNPCLDWSPFFKS